MYNLTIINNFSLPVEILTAGRATTISADGGTNTQDSLGTLVANVTGIGNVLFLDLGEKEIEGYALSGKYGGLVRFEGLEIYFRYDDQANLQVTVDQYGSLSCEVQGGSAIVISLPELSLV